MIINIQFILDFRNGAFWNKERWNQGKALKIYTEASTELVKHLRTV